MKKIIYSSLVLSLFIIPLITVRAETKSPESENSVLWKNLSPKEKENRALEALKLKGIVVDQKVAGKRLENRENNIEKLNARLGKQQEQMTKAKERLINKELKVVSVLEKIAGKLAERISILGKTKGVALTAASAKLTAAGVKIDELTAAENALATLIQTEITDLNKDSLFVEIKTAQDKIRTIARETKTLLVETIKEINTALPAKPLKATTTTPQN